MTKTIRFGAAGIALFAAMGMSNAAFAQTSATADARAEVLDSLVLTNTAALDFGTMVVNGGGSVDLAPDGTLDCGDPDIVCSGTSTVAAFDVEGTASKEVTINLPTADIELRHPGFAGGPNQDEFRIMLNTFVSSTGTTVMLDGAGQGSFNVGGTITLDAVQQAGIYTGTFDVTVEYS